MSNLLPLFRYLSPSSALKTLESRKFRLGLVSEFNDPFDCVFGFDADLKLNEKAKDDLRAFIVKQWDRKYGILCYSKVADEPLMWAHYTDLHRGMVLECGLPATRKLRQNTVITVAYRKRLPLMTRLEVEDTTPHGMGKLMRKALRTKSLHWNYEKEVRVLISLDDPDVTAHSGSYFAPIIGLDRIILGARCAVSRHYVRRILKGSQFENVPIERASLSHSEFKVDIRPFDEWA